jgi:hypothetical protein
LTTASGLGQFLINYAILVIFAVVGLHEAIHHRADPGLTFLGAWLLLQPLMLYAPTNAQQRLILGWQIPLSIFAAYGITRCALPAIARILRVRDWPPNRIRWLQRWIVIGVVLFTDVTYGLLLAWQVVSVTSHQTEYFNSASLLTVVDWLDQHATYADGVLASYSTSTVIPAHAGVRVHAGHHNETAWVDDRMAEIMKFFQRDTPDAWRRDLLMRFSLTYVLVGPEERALGAFNPYTAPYLKLVFESGDVRLYQVKL